MAKPPKKPKDPAHPTRAKAARPASRRRRTRSPTCSIPASTRAPPGWVRAPGYSRRRIIPSTAAPIFPPRTRRASRRRVSARRRRATTPARRSPGSIRRWRKELGLGDELAPAARTATRDEDVRPPRPSASARRRSEIPPAARRPADRARRAVVDGRRRHRRVAGTPAARRPRRNSPRQATVWTPHRPPRPEKSEGGQRFVIKSDFEPKGDQPAAIRELVEGVQRHDRTQVLLGVTGSGKTFTMAKVIEATQRPALILAPNKTLAAQLYGEFKSFFPDNAVEYFVSYYDYYQPEAYVPRTDTYIEKESSINEQIDRMRHSATRSLLERDDVIIVASVSCIYGIGSVETYSAMTFTLKQGGAISQRQLLADLVALQYKRTQARFLPRLVPRARRHHRNLPGALRRPRLARVAVRRRDRVDRRIRSAHRRRRPTSSNSSRSTPTRTMSRRARRSIQAMNSHQGTSCSGRLRAAQRCRPPAGSAAARAAHAASTWR